MSMGPMKRCIKCIRMPVPAKILYWGAAQPCSWRSTPSGRFLLLTLTSPQLIQQLESLLSCQLTESGMPN
uniref:Uncharacterized protein n=1 Tax=Anguilla anguilla TaxID=7936 RepID=A0A0E9XPI6_ANGAN